MRLYLPLFAVPVVRCSDTQGTQADTELAENKAEDCRIFCR